MTTKILAPILTELDIDDAVRSLCAAPMSTVTTRGPGWIRSAEARRIVTDAAVAFSVRADAGSAKRPDVGVLLAERMQTPGHFRVDLWSSDDDDLRRRGVAPVLDEAVHYLCFGVEVSRIDITFGVYNDVMLQALLDSEAFRCEGELRDRFFAAGRYWNGVVFSVTGADLARFRSNDGELGERHRRIEARVKDRIRADIDRRAGA